MTDADSALASLDELEWVPRGQCVVEGFNLMDYFVQAGHSISPEANEACQRCPVRLECLEWAYKKNLGAGYFGGLSHGTRKKLTLEEATAVVKAEQAAYAKEMARKNEAKEKAAKDAAADGKPTPKDTR